jgi:hypothetical protein
MMDDYPADYFFLTDYFLTDYFLTDYFLTDYFLIKLSRWNTTNSPNFTCTAGVGYMSTSSQLRRPPQHKGGKS